MGWDGRALLGQPSRIPHRNLKNSFVLGADALESAYAFMLTHSKKYSVTVCLSLLAKFCSLLTTYLSLIVISEFFS